MAGKATRKATVSPTYQQVSIEDLSGGIDLRRSPTLVAGNRSRTLRNYSLQNPGELNVYPGWASWFTSSLGSSRPQGAQRVYLSSAVLSLVGYSGSVYKPDDAGVPGSAVLTGLSSTHEMFFPYDRDLVAVFDGVNIPKKTIDGSTWYQLGIDPPAAAATGVAAGGGSLISSNDYEFTYSYKRASAPIHEGNEGPTLAKSTGGGDSKITLTIPRSTDAQVDTIVVYARDVTAGESVRRKTGTVANPVAGSATFVVSSKNWTAADTAEAPTDHTVPVAMAFGVVWKNRWWGVDASVGNRLRFTQIFEPQSWPALFYLDIPFERGDSIAAIIAQGDTLVICGQSKIFLIIGQTSLDFEVRPSLGSQAGALGPRAVDALEAGILHASSDGVYIFDGATDRLLTDDLDVAWRNYISTAAVADLAKTPVVYHAARKEVRVGVTVLYPFGTPGEWILDLHRTRQVASQFTPQVPAWTSTDRAVGGYVNWNGNETTTGNRGRVFSWSSSLGKLYEEAVGTTADGDNMVADYEGPALATGFHLARYLDLKGEYRPSPSGTFVLEPYVDGVSMGQIAVDITGGQATYGTAIYGTDAFAGSGRRMFTTELPMEAEGRTVWVRGTYTGKDAFAWFTYAFGMVPEAEARSLA